MVSNAFWSPFILTGWYGKLSPHAVFPGWASQLASLVKKIGHQILLFEALLVVYSSLVTLKLHAQFCVRNKLFFSSCGSSCIVDGCLVSDLASHRTTISSRMSSVGTKHTLMAENLNLKQGLGEVFSDSVEIQVFSVERFRELSFLVTHINSKTLLL